MNELHPYHKCIEELRGYVELVEKSGEQCANLEIAKAICYLDERITELEKKHGDRNKRFVPPTVAEVGGYAATMQWGRVSFNPQYFVDYYAARNWMMGSNKMKDWKAAVRFWHSRNANAVANVQAQKPRIPDNAI